MKPFHSEQYNHNRIESEGKRDGSNWNEVLVPSALRQCLYHVPGESI